MRWLLKLYPRAWRRRYGDELTDLVARQPFSVGAAVDLIAGAIDAWIHPQTSVAPFLLSATKGEATMLTKIARLNCGYGPSVTAADAWKSAAVCLGGTVVLTMIWMWMRRELGDNAYVESLSVLAFLVPLLFSLRYTSLKGRSPGVQVIFIAGSVLLVTAVVLVAASIASRL